MKVFPELIRKFLCIDATGSYLNESMQIEAD